MKTKLCLWVSLSALIACAALAVVNAALGNADAAIYLAAAAVFFGFLSAVFTGDLERWREARENDRDWSIHPRL
jgi:hypothetical protein